MAQLHEKTFKLNNGSEIPAIGLGTFLGGPGAADEAQAVDAIRHALDSGYRLLDTAHIYGTEALVGAAIRASAVPRSRITVVTKLWVTQHADPAAALEASLSALGLDYVDLFLMHWPCSQTPHGEPLLPGSSPTFSETWRLMEGLVGERCRGIGVSNFSQVTLGRLLDGGVGVVPAVNQVELHALNPNLELVPYCRSKGIHVMSWRTIAGLGQGDNPVLTHPLFTQMAASYNCSPASLSLSWAVRRGVSVIPRSTNKARIEQNLRLVDLSDEDVETINGAHRVPGVGRLRIADHIPDLRTEVAGGRRAIMHWTSVDLGWEDEEGNWLV
ncbi:hypothetical protein N3K66_007115 [Trichothecium roseum]|uniref:Uncharacterized protein n=1 Tax=Trichothecium roseum TaxID=47278 RepID=A0ACC0UZ49_9HYPO|nr:hypothetical protein N3K66_007115 [Trichothecium roseum]